MKSNVGSIVKNIVEFKYLWVKLCLALLLRWVNSIPSSTLYHQVILVGSKWALWVLAGQTLTQEQLVGDLLAWESNSQVDGKACRCQIYKCQKGKEKSSFWIISAAKLLRSLSGTLTLWPCRVFYWAKFFNTGKSTTRREKYNAIFATNLLVGV